MSMDSGVSIHPDCITAFNELRLGRGKVKFIIYKISDNKKEVVLEEKSDNPDYEVFRQKLVDAKDKNGKPSPRYAVYDCEFELPGGEGKRSKIVFVSWVPQETPTLWSMIYASTREGFKRSINPQTSIQADDPSELEWKAIVTEASGGKVTQ